MMRLADLDLSTPDAIRHVIARLHTLGCTTGLPTILRDGVLTGVCGLVGIPGRDTAFPAAKLATLRKPAILLIGDDDDAASGPLTWRCAKQAGRWAAAVMVHGAGAEPAHYHAAIQAAALTGRLLLVETSSQHAMAWGRFLAHPRTLLIQTREGVQHPAPRAAGGLH